jgi:hypothetical protein
LSSQHPCAVGPRPCSRQRAFCRPDSAECTMPRASSRHRLCRGELSLYREYLALGKASDSGSATSSTSAIRFDSSLPLYSIPLPPSLSLSLSLSLLSIGWSASVWLNLLAPVWVGYRCTRGGRSYVEMVVVWRRSCGVVAADEVMG